MSTTHSAAAGPPLKPRPRVAEITHLTVGGFRVFDAPVTMPFGRLTLLFGPNSAGKSAVLDALGALHRLLDNDADDHPSDRHALAKNASSALASHWRATPAGQADAPRSELVLGARVRADLSVVAECRDKRAIDRRLLTPGHSALAVQMGFVPTPDIGLTGSPVHLSLAVELMGDWLVELREAQYELEINLSHSLLRGHQDPELFDRLAEIRPNPARRADGVRRVLSIRLLRGLTSAWLDVDSIWDDIEEGLYIAQEKGEGGPPSKELERSFRALLAAVNAGMQLALDAVRFSTAAACASVLKRSAAASATSFRYWSPCVAMTSA